MSASIVNRMVRTSHADISVWESHKGKLPVLFIHGNSCSKEVFKHQFESSLADQFHLIAIDLPGHGSSSDAFRPEATYSFPGYADAAVEVLKLIGIEKFVVVGWSLGGHIGLEMMATCPGVVGVMLMGTPPIGHGIENIMPAFRPHPDQMLIGKRDLSDEELAKFQTLIAGDTSDATLGTALRRADGRARELMMAACFEGRFTNERELAEGSPVPLAIINGACDSIVDSEYIASLTYRNLWEKTCRSLAGVGHMPFAQATAMFNETLRRFLRAMELRTGDVDCGHQLAAVSARVG